MHTQTKTTTSFAYEPWPRAFYDDFVEICKQEAQHFLSWAVRLEEGYGGMRCVPLLPCATRLTAVVLYRIVF